MATKQTGAKTARVALVALPIILGLFGGIAAPAIAGAAASTSCNAVCAQSRTHTPGKATTLAVKWKRYPYAAQTSPVAIDRWGTTERQCTGYVAWALNAMGVDFGMQDKSTNGRTVTFLAARGWAKAARQGGWLVSHTPVVGAVAQWRAHETSYWQTGRGRASFTAGSDGHVGMVTHVYRNGTVLIRQYNVGDPDRSYSTMHAKAARYLHIGVK
jgi:surface antigen